MEQGELMEFDGEAADLVNCRMLRSNNGLDVCLAGGCCKWAIYVLNGKFCIRPSIPPSIRADNGREADNPGRGG